MKQHTITEQISDNTLYVEIEPGLPKSVGTITKSMDFGKPPISIGDTVYQGEEWAGKTTIPTFICKLSNFKENYQKSKQVIQRAKR